MYRVEDYPEIKENYYLKSRNLGASRKLKGDIEIIVCFMKRKPTDFSSSTKTLFSTELSVACDWLKSEAEKYGTKLNFKYRYFTIDIPKDANPYSGYDLIREFFNSQTVSMDKLQKRFKEMSNVDEAPFILVFDESSRSFAFRQSNSYNHQNEISVIFKNWQSYSWTTIAHELLHQFGAFDYYYPPEVTEYANLYIKDSVMGIGKRNVLDDLSAYLVGIKDTISANTYQFLKNTMWIGFYLNRESIHDSWETPYGKRLKEKNFLENQPNFTPVYARHPGTVLKINVSVGQIVNIGDILMTIDIGRDIPVYAIVPGRVDRISVKIGDRVKDGSLVSVIARV